MASKKKNFFKKTEVEVTLASEKRKNRYGKKIIILPVVFVILVLISLAGYLYFQNTQVTNSPTPQQTKALLDRVGNLIMLPSNEQPQVATVTDVSKLSDQPFFAKAQNGDKVLIYQRSAKVILYRPSINKIVDVAPLNTAVSNSAPTPAQSKEVEEATVTVLNGTATSGLAKLAQSKIETAFKNITVSAVGDSAVGGYTNTIVIDVSGKKGSVASQIASLLGGKVETQVPEGENKGNSEILVIIGSDFEGK